MATGKADPWQLIRYALIGVGGAVAGSGGTGVTNNEIETIVGGLIATASAIWGIYVRWNTAAVPNAIADSPDIPTKNSATGKISLDGTASMTRPKRGSL
jgi:hypothetical protein